MEILSKSLIRVLSLFLTLLILSSCKIPKPGDARTMEMEGEVRARKNVEEGRGALIGNLTRGIGRGTTYQFSSSNPMWRASLETLDFLPLTTVDYSGGVIITDWYSDNNSSKESIKISLRFLSNDIRSESLKVIVHQKICSANLNCRVVLLSNTKIKEELHTTILRKAALLEKESKNKKKKK